MMGEGLGPLDWNREDIMLQVRQYLRKGMYTTDGNHAYLRSQNDMLQVKGVSQIWKQHELGIEPHHN